MARTISPIDLRMDDLERLVDRTRHAPLTEDEHATLYELEELRCNLCGEVLTADPPAALGRGPSPPPAAVRRHAAEDLGAAGPGRLISGGCPQQSGRTEGATQERCRSSGEEFVPSAGLRLGIAGFMIGDRNEEDGLSADGAYLGLAMTTGAVHVYSVGAGALTHVTGSPAAFPNEGTLVHAVAVTDTGLVPVAGSPFPTGGGVGSSPLAVSSDGRLLYSTSTGGVSVFGVAADGGLNLLNMAMGGMGGIAAYPSRTCGPVYTISDLAGLAATLNFSQGKNLLDAALRQQEAGNLNAACNGLNAFINQTQAQTGKQLTMDQAGQLIATAHAVRVALGCQ